MKNMYFLIFPIFLMSQRLTAQNVIAGFKFDISVRYRFES